MGRSVAGETHRRAIAGYARFPARGRWDIRAVALLVFLGLPWSATAAPLHGAALHNHHANVAALIAGGAQVNATDPHGDTPLHKAALGDARQAAALLIGNGANVHARNRFGATPLHYAASRNAQVIAALLISNGADANAVDQLEHAPLHWAARENAAETADVLIRRGADAHGVSGWWWFYNYAQDWRSWRRGKAWFDHDMGEFLALEKQRVKKAKSVSAYKNIATGVLGCALANDGCANAALNATANWVRETQLIDQWQAQLSAINKNQTVHAARFLVPPNEQSRPVRVDGKPPFTRFVARLTTRHTACTAFLVRPKIAMTNSHCVCRDPKCDRPIAPAEMTLTFARRDLSGAHDVASGVGKVYASDRSAGYHNDYAFLVLQKAPHLGGHLEVAPDTGDVEAIATAGYPGDLLDGKVMTALWGCRLRTRTNLLFFAEGDCHNYKGASGSPYIAVDGRHRGKVVGINAFGAYNNESVGGGPSVSAFYRRLREIIERVE